MSKKIEEILESINSEFLTDEVKTGIKEAFGAAVDEKVEQSISEKVELSVNAALEKVDEEYAQKVSDFAEKMDRSHVTKAEELVKKLDEAYAEKLKMVAEAYKKELSDNVSEFQDSVVSKVSQFIDMRLDKLVPVEQLEEAVQNINAVRLIGEIRKLLAFDPSELSEDIKSAVKESYDTIESLKKELNEKSKQCLVVESELKGIKAEKLLSEKVEGLSPKKAKYVQKALRGKTPEFISENFDYVVGMFDESEKSAKEDVLKEELDRSVSSKTEVPRSVKSESDSPKGEVEQFTDELKKLARR